MISNNGMIGVGLSIPEIAVRSAGGGIVPPPEGSQRITEDSNDRITEAGDRRVTE